MRLDDLIKNSIICSLYGSFTSKSVKSLTKDTSTALKHICKGLVSGISEIFISKTLFICLVEKLGK